MNKYLKSELRKVRDKLRYCKDCSILFLWKNKSNRICSNPKIYLIGTEDFGNLGDHHIAVSINQFLHENFLQTDIIEVTASEYYKKRSWLIKNIKVNDIIVMTGGGNFGNVYIIAQLIRRDIIKFWKKNFKIVMPVTVYYDDSKEGKRQKAIDQHYFSKENNIIIVTREKMSYQLASEQFDCKIILTPDIVFRSNYEEVKNRNKKILFCIRNDMESKIAEIDKERMLAISKKFFEDILCYDTQKEYCITKNERDLEINKCIKEFQNASLVITDRLHGMIFSVITGTPCIVLGNYNHKVRDSYDWVKDFKSICFVENILEFEKAMSEMSLMNAVRYDNKPYIKYYEKIACEIKERL